jgi:hypothetical protein
VTTWTTAGSVVAAAVLAAVLAHGTSSAATTSTDQNGGDQVVTPDGTENGGLTGNGQLQVPQDLPGVAGGRGRHGSSGGS